MTIQATVGAVSIRFDELPASGIRSTESELDGVICTLSYIHGFGSLESADRGGKLELRSERHAMESSDARCEPPSHTTGNKAAMTKAKEWLMKGRISPSIGLSTGDPSTLTGVG